MNQIKKLALTLITPDCLPPLLWGGFGIGKSAQVVQMADALKEWIEAVIAAIRAPEDFGGLPVPSLDGHTVNRIADSWATRLVEKGKGILFLDEISCAAPATQSALLRVVLERTVGDLKLPDGVRIIAAANPPDTAAGGWELAEPLANRFVHFEWQAEPEAFIRFLGGGRVSARDIPTLDHKRWEREFVKAKAILAAYIRRNPGALTEDAKTTEGRFPPAIATPRTWECAARLQATCAATGNDELMVEMAEAVIGEGHALQYATYVREMDLPDPEELLNDPSSYVPDEVRLDRTFATLLAVAAVATATPIKKARWQAAWEVLDKALHLGADIVAVPVMTLADRDKRPKGGLTSTPAVKRVATQIRDVVSVAGLLE